MKVKNSMSRRLMVLQFSYLAALSGFMNYLTLYLYEAGLSEMQIGVIYALSAPATLVIQPLVGRVLDRWQNFRSLSVAGLAVFTLGIAAIPMPSLMPLVRLGLIFVVYALSKQFGGVFDLWTYRLQSEYPGVEYGKSRGVGSIGVGVATLVMGYFIEWWGFGAMFTVTVALLMVVIGASLSLPDPSAAPGEDPKQQKSDFSLMKGPIFWYILSFLVLKISVTLIGTFSSILVDRLGGSSATFGVTILLCAVTEVFVFTDWGRRCPEMNPRKAYLLCVATVFAGSIWTSLAPNIPLFLVGRILLTIAYAMYTVFNLEFIRASVPEAARGRVFLTLAALSTGVSFTVSSLLGGVILEIGSPVSMAVLTGAVTAAAFALHFRAFPKAA